MSTVVDATDATFDDLVLKSELPVLVDFWADWCGPCKKLAPVLDELATDFAGTVQIVKVNIDQNFEVASKTGVTSLPTLNVYHNGQLVKTITDYRTKAAIATELKNAIAG